jgi:hypothetical protein
MSSEKSISSLQESLVKVIRSLVSGKAVKTSATSGLKPDGSSAKLGPGGSWLRTWMGYVQLTMDGSSQLFSLTWSKWGTVLDGQYTGLRRLVRHTSETESSLWRTPQAADAKSAKTQSGHTMNLTHQIKWPTPRAEKVDGYSSPEFSPTLGQAVRSWPTPTARDHKSGTGAQPWAGHAQPLTDVVQGRLNPEWVESLMGLPQGWTDISGQLDQDHNIQESRREL